MELIDTQTHLDFPEFDADRAAVLAAARQAGVVAMVVSGVSAATWSRLLALTDAEPGLFPALGLHPMFLAEHNAADLTALAEAVERHRPVAVGEIGLDFQLRELDRPRQLELFEAQLAVARDARLPVILHVRKAHDEVLARLRRFDLVGGTVHAFSGSRQQAEHYLALGFKLGFGGAMTYSRARKLRTLAAELPLEALVLETDSPDLPPAAHHGERNSPAYLPEIAAVLAELRGEDPLNLARRTTDNARTVFGLPA
ncbi:MAG TPA: TatD family hydrolase [Gammaproteobacteria bacterium]|nr:TatD family hydrolase [Gammaproteobacteria bacterium]